MTVISDLVWADSIREDIVDRIESLRKTGRFHRAKYYQKELDRLNASIMTDQSDSNMIVWSLRSLHDDMWRYMQQIK